MSVYVCMHPWICVCIYFCVSLNVLQFNNSEALVLIVNE